MFKFITNYFEEKKKCEEERKAILKIRKETTGFERLTKYHRGEIREKNNIIHDDRLYVLLDIIDTLEEHDKRINVNKFK